MKDYGKDRNPENHCVVQDHRGVIYVGHSHGVLEFDGEKWNFITVGIGRHVRAMAIDKDGVIFVGTAGDFGYLAPNDEGELKFVSLLNLVPKDDQYFGDIWKIYANDDHIYFQSQEVLFDYEKSKDSVNIIYPQHSYHTSFLVDGTLFLRDRTVGIVKLNGSERTTLGGTEIFQEYGLFGMHKLEDDSLLLVTQELGLYKWANGAMRQLPQMNELRLDELGIIGSLELSDGDIALNTIGNGVTIINKAGQIIHQLNKEAGIRSNVVQYIYQDRDLNLWLALENGISKVNYYSPLSYFGERTGLEGDVQCVIRYKGLIYVGTSNGLFVENNTILGANRFLNTNAMAGQVWSFETVDETLIIAAAKGLFNTKDGINYRQINLQNTNSLVYRTQMKDFITGGSNGIYVYDSNFNEKWSIVSNLGTFLGAEVDPKNDSIIWLGTTSSGLYRLKEQNNGDFEIDQYGDIDGLLEGLGKPIIYGDSLIFGAKDGLLYFVNEDQMRKELASQLTAEELADPAFVKGIFERYVLEDSVFLDQFLLLEKGEDRTWYCHDSKVGYYDNETKVFKNRPFWGINYGRINTFYLEDDGVLWIGAGDGLIRYEKNLLKNYESHFYSLIRNVKLVKGDTLFNGIYLDPNGGFAMEQAESQIPEVAYKYNDIEFLFSAPYFEDEHQPEYRYFLVGYDDNWSDWKVKSDAGYNNLHEGEYTFKVEARNIYGQTSEEAIYSFVVLAPWYRTTLAYVLYFIGFVLVLLLGVGISSKRLKAKNAWLEEVVEERTKEISAKNIVLEHQKQEIQDSINYAQRIQEAILPLEDEMKKWLPNSFVLFRPKDVVSGDFYWFLERDNKLVLICADCTGHGVPGAFMSMIGSDRLNNIVSEKKITSPSAILSELNRAIKKSLKQDGQKNSTRDGMDASVITIDLAKNKLYYAGAHRSLWIVDAANDNAFSEIKATKVAVAGFTPDDQVYTEHEIDLTKGMKFYMTTDGFADQFGGERDKKYKVKNMKSFIINNSHLPYDEQRKNLEKELYAWMGEREQVDDVCVIGFEC